MLRLRGVEAADGEQVLRWRNQDDVRRWMYTDHLISQEEHEQWFASMRQDPTKQYWIIELEDLPVGVIHLSDISRQHRRCEWGMYLGSDAARGTGAAESAAFLSLDAAFGEIGMQRVTCEVLVGNERAIRLYERVGFRREGLLRSMIARGSERYDVIVMGVLQSEWAILRPGLVGRMRNRGFIGEGAS